MPAPAATTRRPPLIHLAGQLFNTPLALLPEKAEILLRAFGSRLVAEAEQPFLQQFLSSGALKTANFDPITDLSAFDDSDFDENRPKSAKPYSITDSGVAIIPVKGVLMKKGGWLASASGCSTYAGVTSAVSAAMDDLVVKGILLDVDSPGGTTHGCFEASDALHAFRGKKPMYAVANDLAASAAYALASSADRIFITRTAGVGSVGVFSLHTEQAAADEQAGVKYTYVYFGEDKVAGNLHEPLSTSAYNSIKKEVDRQGRIFVSTVSRNRGVSKQSIMDTKAQVWSEDRALPLLADAVGTYDDALSALNDRLTGKISVSMVSSTISSTQGTQGETPMALDATDLTPTAIKAADFSALIAAEVAKGIAAALPSIITAVSAAKPKDDDNDEKDEPDDDEDDKKKMKGKSAKSATSGKSAKRADDYAETTEDEDEDKERKNRDKDSKAAIAAASLAATNASIEIAELCSIAGHTDLLASFLSDRKSVADVRKTLHELRAKESAATSVSSSFGTVSTEALSTISQQTDALVATSGGTLSRAAAMMRLLKRNPKLYNQYENERRVALLSPNGIEQYAYHVQQQASAFDLSSELGQFGPKEQIGGGGVVK